MTNYSSYAPGGSKVVKQDDSVVDVLDQDSNAIKVKVVNNIPIEAGDIEIGAVEIKDGMSDTRAVVDTAEADGVANTKNTIAASARASGFNGTTWDRLRAGLSDVASALTGILNTLPLALYHSSRSTRTDGLGGPLESNIVGDLSVTQGTLLAGEDLIKDVITTRRRGVYAYISTATTTYVFPGSGHINNIKVAGGTLGNVTIYDNTAASGTVILPAVTPVQGQELIVDIDVTLGCTIVTAAATILTISYDN